MSAISSYFTDIIDIIQVKLDENNVISETPILNVSCRIEDENRLIINSQGKEIMGKMIIWLDPEQEIDHQDKIRIKIKSDNAYPYPDKKFQVHQINHRNMFCEQDIEVVI